MIFNTIEELQLTLKGKGCNKCDLGFQDGLNGCCVSRGNHFSRRMIIGEAPGKMEDATSEPFIGPAGQLMEKIFSSVGLDTNKDFYVTNIVLCRPIAAKWSGKENYTPRPDQRRKCRPYLDGQIDLIRPKIIVSMGKPATEAMLGAKDIKMKDYRGMLIQIPYPPGFGKLTFSPYLFPMYHPAFLLHGQNQPEKNQLARQEMWKDIQKLKEVIVQLKL